jgi:hypothetical protein
MTILNNSCEIIAVKGFIGIEIVRILWENPDGLVLIIDSA